MEASSDHKMSPLVMAVSCSPFLMRLDHCDSLILLDEDGLPESRRQNHASLLGENRLSGEGSLELLLNVSHALHEHTTCMRCIMIRSRPPTSSRPALISNLLRTIPHLRQRGRPCLTVKQHVVAHDLV